jgi:hypothetical protein
MNIIPMKPDDERVAEQPTHGAADYRTRFATPCALTYSDNRLTSIFEGTGIAPERHPLERQFAMLWVPFTGCGRCAGTNVLVFYARFIRPLDEPAPGEVLCDYELACDDCGGYTYRHFTL